MGELTYNDCHYLTPTVHCSNVTMPDTKMMVETMVLRAGSSSSMHSAGVKMNGNDMVLPIIVR